MTTTEDLLVRTEWEVDGVRGVTVRINRPEQRNPLDHDTVRGLLEQIELAESDPTMRGFIVTGNGAAFSAGGDLRKYLDLYRNPLLFRAFLDDFKVLCERLERSPLVTCAMVNGACVAGGLELALACDFISLAESARIGDGHLGSGQLPGAGGSQRLGRALGWQKAKEWLLSGRLYSSAEAEAVGLAAFVSPDAELEEATIAFVAVAGAHSPLAYRTMKKLIDVGRQTSLGDGLDTELSTVHEYATTSGDAMEGLHAFLDKRPPAYESVVPLERRAYGDAGATPRTQKGNRTRAALKASARTVFGRSGYGNARVSDITSEAKLSQGSFYRYFPDKETVLKELLEDLLRDVVAFARDSWRSNDPAASVHQTTHKYLSFYQENADLYAMLIEVAQSDGPVRAMWIEARDVFYQRIARMITRAQQEGLADPALDAEFAATLLGGMTEQYAYASFVEGRPSHLEFDEVVAQMSRIWAHAIFRGGVPSVPVGGSDE
jgi:enoyl-CoA hydratase/carnithine racemase/AcrR family transcriptional regulator